MMKATIMAVIALLAAVHSPENSSVGAQAQTAPSRALDSVTCQGLGNLSVTHERSFRKMPSATDELFEILRVMLESREDASPPVELWRSEREHPEIAYGNPRVRAEIQCDWRSREVFLVLFFGQGLHYSAEMIRISPDASASPSKTGSTSQAGGSGSLVGKFQYNPEPLVAGDMLLSSLQLGPKMLLHVEAAGRGAYSGALFLLDFAAGSSQRVELQGATRREEGRRGLLEFAPVSGGLPVPWKEELNSEMQPEAEVECER